jgi:hypothetical protein
MCLDKDVVLVTTVDEVEDLPKISLRAGKEKRRYKECIEN